MSRSDAGEAEYDSEVDIDALLDEGERSRRSGETDADAEPAADAATGERAGVRDRVRSRLPSRPSPVFTARGFGLSVAACVVGFLVAGTLVPLGGVAGLIGVLVAGFLLGMVGRRRYLELAAAGAVTAAAGALLSRLVLAAAGDLAVPLVAVGGTAGLAAAVAGHYLGRDLRDGLTRSL
jgi:hypothetical protein